MRIRYDVHIHSCLSPCGDDELTPAFVAGAAKLGGLDVVALSDHNSAKNCPAFLTAAEFYGIAALPGIELSTVEGVHVLCLFECLDDALKFDEYVSERLIKMENRPEFFGNQLVMNEDDEIVAREPYLLSGDTEIPFNEARELVARFGGVALPAHIDRKVNGAVEIFGTVPTEAGFCAFELRAREKTDEYMQYMTAEPLILYNSDAHFAEDIGSAGGTITLDDGEIERYGLAGAFIRHIKNRA